MERDLVPRDLYIVLIRKLQLAAMITCVASYVLISSLYVFFYEVREHESLKPITEKCGNRSQMVISKKEFIVTTDYICPCETKTCVPRCCGFTVFDTGNIFDLQNCGCVDLQNLQGLDHLVVSDMKIKLYYDFPKEFDPERALRMLSLRDRTVEEINATLDPKSLQQNAQKTCSESERFLQRNELLKKHLFTEGDPFNLSSIVISDLDHYCNKHRWKTLGSLPTSLDCADGSADGANYIAYITKTYYLFEIETHIAFGAISLTVVVYLYFPEMRTLYGKTLVGYLINKWATFALHFMSVSNNFTSPLPPSIAFAFVANEYYWHTTICFSLWLSSSRSLEDTGNIFTNLKLASYFYPLATPLLMQIFQELHLWVINQSVDCGLWQLDTEHCTLLRKRSVMILTWLPSVFLQILLNVVIFLSVVVNHRLSSRMSGADSRSPMDREGVRMYLLLFLFSGQPFAVYDRTYHVGGPRPDSLWVVSTRHLENISPIAVSCVLLIDARVFKLLGLARYATTDENYNGPGMRNVVEFCMAHLPGMRALAEVDLARHPGMMNAAEVDVAHHPRMRIAEEIDVAQYTGMRNAEEIDMARRPVMGIGEEIEVAHRPRMRIAEEIIDVAHHPGMRNAEEIDVTRYTGMRNPEEIDIARHPRMRIAQEIDVAHHPGMRNVGEIRRPGMRIEEEVDVAYNSGMRNAEEIYAAHNSGVRNADEIDMTRRPCMRIAVAEEIDVATGLATNLNWDKLMPGYTLESVMLRTWAKELEETGGYGSG